MISVIAVTYNSRADIGGFLLSLSDVARKFSLDLETHITDNASSDGTIEFLREAILGFPELKITLSSNRCNVGLSKALSEEIELSNGDMVLVCNPDIVFDDSINRLISYGQKCSERGRPCAVVPELLNGDGSVQKQTYRRYPTLARVLMAWTFMGGQISRLFPSILDDYTYAKHEFSPRLDLIEQASAVCLLIDRKTVTTLSPLFDPAFPVFWNDVDMVMRAKYDHDILFYIMPEAHVFHKLGTSSKKIIKVNPERAYMLGYSSHGLIGFARRWKMYPRIIQAFLFFDAIAQTLAQLILEVIGRKTKRARGSRIKMGLIRFRSSLQ